MFWVWLNADLVEIWLRQVVDDGRREVSRSVWGSVHLLGAKFVISSLFLSVRGNLDLTLGGRDSKFID